MIFRCLWVKYHRQSVSSIYAETFTAFLFLTLQINLTSLAWDCVDILYIH